MTYTEKQREDIIKLADFHISVSEKDQIIKAIEELSSLNKMLCKLLLGEIKYHDIELLDELFDADVMIMSMKRLIISEDVIRDLYDNVVENKLIRESKRWGVF